jgi:hypothetical protein
MDRCTKWMQVLRCGMLSAGYIYVCSSACGRLSMICKSPRLSRQDIHFPALVLLHEAIVTCTTACEALPQIIFLAFYVMLRCVAFCSALISRMSVPLPLCAAAPLGTTLSCIFRLSLQSSLWPWPLFIPQVHNCRPRVDPRTHLQDPPQFHWQCGVHTRTPGRRLPIMVP